jgi:hypothetical protein
VPLRPSELRLPSPPCGRVKKAYAYPYQDFLTRILPLLTMDRSRLSRSALILRITQLKL